MNQLKILFQVATVIALVGWLAIIVMPSWAYTATVTLNMVAALAVLYLYLLFAKIPGVEKTRGSFSSLGGVIALFKSPKVMLAGWVHFLAFDLVVALYIRADAPLHGIQHLWLIPIYLLTLMFGPAGLLAYFGLRLAVGT
jgi:Domain of unknown function (DUF4281)